jgi:hypothetical protein
MNGSVLGRAAAEAARRANRGVRGRMRIHSSPSRAAATRQHNRASSTHRPARPPADPLLRRSRSASRGCSTPSAAARHPTGRPTAWRCCGCGPRWSAATQARFWRLLARRVRGWRAGGGGRGRRRRPNSCWPGGVAARPHLCLWERPGGQMEASIARLCPQALQLPSKRRQAMRPTDLPPSPPPLGCTTHPSGNPQQATSRASTARRQATRRWAQRCRLRAPTTALWLFPVSRAAGHLSACRCLKAGEGEIKEQTAGMAARQALCV